MSRFSKMSLLVVFCGVAILLAPPAAHAKPVLLINNTPQTLIPDGQDEFTFSGTFAGTTPGNKFTVNVIVTSNAGSAGTQGVLQAQVTVTETFSTRDQITIRVTDSGYLQNTNNQPTATLSAKVNVTVTGQGSATFRAASFNGETAQFVLWNGQTSFTLSTFPPIKDASATGSGSSTVTDPSPYPMSTDATVTGGDVIYNIVLKNTVN